MNSNLFIEISAKIFLLGWLAKIHLTTQILRSDVVGENVFIDIVVENIAVVSPHVVREDVGGSEGVRGGGVWDKSRASSDGNTAVEGGLRVGVEHLRVGVGGLDNNIGVVGGGDGNGGGNTGDHCGALVGSNGGGSTSLVGPRVVGEPGNHRIFESHLPESI